MTATTTDLRARARAAHDADWALRQARIDRDNAEAGALLARVLRERLGVALPATPSGHPVEHEGIHFSVTYDNSRGYRDAWRSWELHAALILSGDEYGDRTSERVRIETLADLGALLTESEGRTDS